MLSVNKTTFAPNWRLQPAACCECTLPQLLLPCASPLQAGRQAGAPVMLPSAALMPPCAATVWLRVGNSLVMHLQQAEERVTWSEQAEARAALAQRSLTQLPLLPPQCRWLTLC